MPRNGQGIYTLPVGNPVITGTTITSTWGNTTMQDIANALTGSVASDGQTTMSGPLNMGSNRINNVDNPVLPQDAATMDYVDTIVGELGTMARQNADNVQITGGSIIGVFLDLSGTTGQMYIPVGTTNQRTQSPKLGLLRFNTDTIGLDQGFYEGWTAQGWRKFTTTSESIYDVDYFMVAGGGGGGSSTSNPLVFTGGGGGGGGWLSSAATGKYSVLPGNTYEFVIGGGGGAYTNGANTTGLDFTAYGGGGGGGGGNPTGKTGGSGGGSTAGAGAGAGIPPQGNNGATNGGGGGGGAPAPSATGGAGTSTAITGTTTYFAGGGGGGTYDSAPTAYGGIGGGGTGGNSTGQPFPGAGTENTGGGGGGASMTQNQIDFGRPGGNGGSGIFILSIPTARYSGVTTGTPQVTIFGDNTVLTYRSSGSYTA